MHQPVPPESSLLDQTAEAFARWRAAKTGRRRIPPHLWEMAAQAAQVHGVSKTARRLKLDYYRLRRRLEGDATTTRRSAKTGEDRRRTISSTAFVELPPVATARDHAECELEFEDGQGTRLVLRWKGNSAPDLALLGQLLHQR